MKIKPFENKCILEYVGMETVTKGGIHLAQNSTPPVTVWKVIDRGPGARTSSGDFLDFPHIRVGMQVALPNSIDAVIVSHDPKQMLTDMEWIAGEVEEWTKAPERPHQAPGLALPDKTLIVS